MHRSGTGRPIDLEKALKWYRRAAERGDAIAQMNLGEMYMQGAGVKRDRIEAYIWLTRAARQGRDWAAGQRNRVANRMTAREIATARSRLKPRLAR